MKKIAVIVALLVLGGCAIPPKQAVSKISSNEDSVKLSERLYGLANNCWERDWGWFGDGVIVSTRIDFRGRVIEAKRFAPDIDVRPEFLELIVTESGGKSYVEIWEGGEFNPLSDNSMVPEIQSWVSGSNTCITEK